MNHILSDQTHGLKFAIIENEFGEVGVDEKIVKQQESLSRVRNLLVVFGRLSVI